MPKELWKWVPGYEGYYQVSNRGRVRSVTREVIDSLGHVRKYRGKVMRLWRHNNGYPVCELKKAGHGQLMRVHTLVLEAFVGQAPNGYEAHHKNGDRADNSVENLEWILSFQHKSMHKKNATEPEGMFQKGERHPKAKLTKSQVLEIYRIGQTESHGVIADRYGVERSTISQILSGRTWAHLYHEGNR